MRKLFLALAAAFLGNGAVRASEIAITNISVIDVGTGKVERGQTVIVADGVVKSVQSRRPPRHRKLQVIDARGKYMLPGLWDMGSFALNGTRGPALAGRIALKTSDVSTEEIVAKLLEMRDQLRGAA